VVIFSGSEVLIHAIDVLTFGFHFALQADVNTVCFADETGHLIYSGSDDSFCKVCSTL
jgi:WD repeat-containing protein 23